MVINHLIRTVLLLAFLSTCVGAIKPTKPHSVKPIPSRGSADPYKGQRIEGDGNCFYRSLSLYLYDSQEYHRNVRQQILTFMSDREDRYQRLIERNVNYHDYARYISDHRRDGVWAEDAIAQAAADLYGIDIYVTHYSSNGETSQHLQLTRARSEQNSQRWLHLQLHVQQSHYEIINDYSEEGVSEPSCHSDLLSIQDPAEVETLGRCGMDICEKDKASIQESGRSKLIPEEEMPEIKDPPMEEETTNKMSERKVIPEEEMPEIKDPPMEEESIYKMSESKLIPEGEEMEILHPPMEERNIPHSNTRLPDEELSDPLVKDTELTEKIDPSSEDNVDNICRGFNVVKIHEEEKDFEDQHQKKRIRNSIYQVELKQTESRLIGNERDLTSGRPIVENLGRLEDLHIELEGEACSEIPVNEVLRSDSEESIENRTDVRLEKKTH
ncbi:uncharacterized protein LOC134266536, partial [Saccostrea cucullata]|uniref:uncharacterized protein LOC134266536 n=1 Tax=Saccostrea cuccullata TaxID=36930 RepID=UPI002ED33D79